MPLSIDPLSPPTIEVLFFDGCPSHERLMPRLEQLVREAGMEAPILLRRVETPEAAEAERFLGSPSVRVNGRDVEPGASGRRDFGLKCRLYRSEHGSGALPPDEWIRAALEARAPAPVEPTAAAVEGPVDVDKLAEAIACARPQLDRRAQQLALALYRLLAAGEAVSAQALAAASGESVQAAQEFLDSSPEVLRNDESQVIGFAGLSLTPTTHCLELGGRRLTHGAPGTPSSCPP